MRCPKCGLINPENSSRCDCGYEFISGKMKESYLANKEISVSNLASLSQRLSAQIIDSLIAVAVIILSVTPFIISKGIGRVTLICGILFALFYTLFADGFKGGQSFGKRMMKTAVVDSTTGTPCTFGKSFVRNLLLILLGIIDWVLIFGHRRQRLGDKAADTLVLKVDPT